MGDEGFCRRSRSSVQGASCKFLLGKKETKLHRVSRDASTARSFMVKIAWSGGTPRGTPRGSRTPRTPFGSVRGSGGEVPASGQNQADDMQLAIIPEHGSQALVHVEVSKPIAKAEVPVFPTFLGKAPQALLKDDTGAMEVSHKTTQLGQSKLSGRKEIGRCRHVSISRPRSIGHSVQPAINTCTSMN